MTAASPRFGCDAGDQILNCRPGFARAWPVGMARLAASSIDLRYDGRATPLGGDTLATALDETLRLRFVASGRAEIARTNTNEYGVPRILRKQAHRCDPQGEVYPPVIDLAILRSAAHVTGLENRHGFL